MISESYQSSQAQISTKEIIQRFSNDRFMLRPASLKKVEAILRANPLSQSPADTLNAIIYNIKNLIQHNQSLVDKGILEPSIMEEAIELYQKSLRAPTEDMQLEIKMDKMNLGSESETANNSIDSIIDLKLKSSIVCLNAFRDFPYIYYDTQRGCFDVKTPTPEILGTADAKIEMFNERFDIIKEKLMRSAKHRFSHQSVLKNKSQDSIEISAIGSLLGSTGEKTVLGLLTQQELGTYYLEDNHTKVKISTKSIKEVEGFFVEGNIVLARGEYNETDSRFHVKSFLHPLVDYKDFSAFLQNKDTFGAISKVERILSSLLSLELGKLSLDPEDMDSWEKRKKIDQAYSGLDQKQAHLGIYDLKLDRYWKDQDFSDSSVIVLSNLLIDSVDSLERFEKVLKDCSLINPLMFVIIGDLSQMTNYGTTEEYDEFNQHLDSFIRILDEFPTLEDNCYWVFIPGPNDVGLNTFPMREYPHSLLGKLQKKLKHFINGSNPFRMSIFGKEFTFVRRDILKDLRRNSVVQSEQLDLREQLYDSVLAQSHLIPLSLYTQPIIWNYDYTMRLLKLPNFLVMADSLCSAYHKGFQNISENVFEHNILNPGNFAKTGSFAIIKPNTLEILKYK